MAEVAAAFLFGIVAAGFLVLCSLPLVPVIALVLAERRLRKIRKAAKNAEAILDGTAAATSAEIRETAKALGMSGNSYNKELMGKLLALPLPRVERGRVEGDMVRATDLHAHIRDNPDYIKDS